MMECGPSLGTAAVSMMHSLEMMIDSLPFNTVSPTSLACLLIVIAFLSFIKLSGSKWSALPFSASVHCLLKIGGGMFASRFPLPRWKSTGLQKLCVSGRHLRRFYSVTLSVQSHLEPVEAHEQAPIWSEASIFLTVWSLLGICVCALLISVSRPVSQWLLILDNVCHLSCLKNVLHQYNPLTVLLTIRVLKGPLCNI